MSHQRRDNVNIGTAIEIYARPKNKLKNFFGLSKSIHRKLSVSLVNFAADPDLVLSDEMISVLIDSEPEMMRRGNSVPIEINGETTRFQLIFHPSSVLDCKRVQGRGSNTFDISFSLSLRDEKNNEICSQKVELGIDLVPVDFRPEVEMSVIPPLQFMSFATLTRLSAFLPWGSRPISLPHAKAIRSTPMPYGWNSRPT